MHLDRDDDPVGEARPACTDDLPHTRLGGAEHRVELMGSHTISCICYDLMMAVKISIQLDTLLQLDNGSSGRCMCRVGSR